MKLKFKTVKDLLSFIKMALYMNEKRAAQKMLKWKKNGELYIIPDRGKFILELSSDGDKDEEFNDMIKNKYDIWLKSNKQTTLGNEGI